MPTPASPPREIPVRLTCGAMSPMLSRSETCGLTATAVMDFGCVHEHVKRTTACASHETMRHECRDCWELDGHRCAMVAKLVTRL